MKVKVKSTNTMKNMDHRAHLPVAMGPSPRAVPPSRARSAAATREDPKATKSITLATPTICSAARSAVSGPQSGFAVLL